MFGQIQQLYACIYYRVEAISVGCSKLSYCEPSVQFSARIAEIFHQQRGVIKEERGVRERRGTVDQHYRHIRRFHEIPIFFSTAAEHIRDVRGGQEKKKTTRNKNTTATCISLPLENLRKKVKRNVMQLPDTKDCVLVQDADTPDSPGLCSCQKANKKKKKERKNQHSKEKGRASWVLFRSDHWRVCILTR